MTFQVEPETSKPKRLSQFTKSELNSGRHLHCPWSPARCARFFRNSGCIIQASIPDDDFPEVNDCD